MTWKRGSWLPANPGTLHRELKPPFAKIYCSPQKKIAGTEPYGPEGSAVLRCIEEQQRHLDDKVTLEFFVLPAVALGIGEQAAPVGQAMIHGIVDVAVDPQGHPLREVLLIIEKLGIQCITGEARMATLGNRRVAAPRGLPRCRSLPIDGPATPWSCARAARESRCGNAAHRHEILDG